MDKDNFFFKEEQQALKTFWLGKGPTVVSNKRKKTNN